MSVIEEGQLKGSFNGYKSNDVVFEFFSGKKWKQDEYKYNYYYSYMPRAKIIEDMGWFYLEVDGMNERIRVKRVY